MNERDAGGAQGQTPGGNMGEVIRECPCSSLRMLRRGPLHRHRGSWGSWRYSSGKGETGGVAEADAPPQISSPTDADLTR